LLLKTGAKIIKKLEIAKQRLQNIAFLTVFFVFSSSKLFFYCNFAAKTV